MLRRLGIIGLMMVALSVLVTPIAACGSAVDWWSIDHMLEWSDYYVKGKIVEIDDAGQNFILEIEHSLKGTPPKKALLYNTNPLVPRAYLGHDYYNACTYSGGSYFAVGETGYFPLRHLSNGSYETLLHSTQYSEFTARSEATIRTDPNYVENGDGFRVYDAKEHLALLPTPTEQDFIKLVQERGGNSPILPKDESIYPLLYAPVFIETDANERYIIPIDGGDLIPASDNILLEQVKWGVSNLDGYAQNENLCTKDQCLNFSSDVSLFTLVKTSDLLLLDFPGNWFDGPTSELPGQYSIFAPTNDSIAIWNDGVIDIYEIKWNHYPKPDKIANLKMNISQPVTRELAEQSIQWSENGNVLTYADDDGVWWFDLYHESEPKMVIEADSDNIPRIVQLSSDGRFIGYSLDGNMNQWELRDMNTGKTYANSLITPNGRNSIQINPGDLDEENSLPQALQNARPYTLNSGESWEIEWIGSDGYIITFCDSQRQNCHGDYCRPGSFDDESNAPKITGCGSFPKNFFYRDRLTPAVTTGHADYALELGVVVSGEDELVFCNRNLLCGWNYRKLSLKGNITHVEWMLPLFYYRD